MLNQKRLHELLNYDKNTGIFTWKAKRKGTNGVGSVAGCQHNAGYVRISIDFKRYLAHRLAWMYVYGVFPKDQIDHINGIRTDNRIINLRQASDALNRQNLREARSDNSCGFLGVNLFKRTGKYRASIQCNGEVKHIGYFNNPEDAHNAYIAEKRKIHAFCTI